MDQKQPKNRPVAVVISDIHFTLGTLEEATTSLRAAIDMAAELDVPLVDGGDLTNDKAILRAEIVNRLLELKDYARHEKDVRIISLVGNHSLLNEKSTEANALNFLNDGYWDIVRTPMQINAYGFIPYQPNADDFYKAIEKFRKGSIVFGHQGTVGGQMGDYVQDPSRIDPSRIKDWRVFLGHYHKHYDLENTVSIGNPYTLTFGEANDPEKGFLVVYADGSYRRQLTGLRRHVIWEGPASRVEFQAGLGTKDLIWIKLHGTPSELVAISKDSIAKLLERTDFKLDKIPIETPGVTKAPEETKTQAEIMDGLVDALHETSEQTQKLKDLWREALKCA